MRAIRVLMQDVVNPLHDRRIKYGLRSVRSFKSGTRFAVEVGAADHLGGVAVTKRTLVLVSTVVGRSSLRVYEHGDTALFVTLMAASAVQAPQTWMEIKAANAEGHEDDGIEGRVLDILLSTGAVSREHLSGAMNRVITEIGSIT